MPGRWGYFGKLPSRGDFIRKDLPQDFVQSWDEWVQSLLLTGREELGEAWQNAYFSAPIWRFALAAGMCGPSRMVGVVMPSVDRVGRQFPFTIATVADDGPVWSLYQSASACFASLEDAALTMLEDDADPAALEERLASVSLMPAPEPMIAEIASGMALSSSGRIADAFAGSLLDRHLGARSIWISDVGGIQRALALSGMPEGPDAARAMLDLSSPAWSGGGQDDLLRALL